MNGTPNMQVFAEAKFWSSVDVRKPHECWPWKRGFGGHGYGNFYAPQPHGRTKQITAHRFAAELAHGKPEAGFEAIHACDNKTCVNPAHLRWGTHAENMAEAGERGLMNRPQVTHCPQGHEYTPANTLTKPVRARNGKTYTGRSCRECNRQYLARRRAENRSK